MNSESPQPAAATCPGGLDGCQCCARTDEAIAQRNNLREQLAKIQPLMEASVRLAMAHTDGQRDRAQKHLMSLASDFWQL